MARFSLVASACMSTRTIFACVWSRMSSTTRKGLSVFASSVKRPMRLMTQIGPPRTEYSPQPRPGHCGAKFAGRRMRFFCSRYGCSS